MGIYRFETIGSLDGLVAREELFASVSLSVGSVGQLDGLASQPVRLLEITAPSGASAVCVSRADPW